MRNSQYDKNDFIAFIYTRVVSESEKNRALLYRLYLNNLRFDNTQLFTSSYAFNNIVKYDMAYNDGYNDGEAYGYSTGYQYGYRIGTEEATEELTNYYTKPNEGYQTIYSKGYNDGENAQIDFGFFTNIFNDVDAFFSIHIAPFLTIGELITAPLIIYFVWFIIKQFTGGN